MSKFILIILVSFNAYGITRNISTKYGTVSLTPIIVFEKVQKSSPTPHLKARTLYGLRATWQKGIIALETEYTTGKDLEYFSATDQTISENVKKIKLGIKANFALNTLLTCFLRGGAQLKRSDIATTKSNITTTKQTAAYVDPYIGTGLSIQVLDLFSLNAGVNAVYSNYPNKGKIETDTSFGVSFHY